MYGECTGIKSWQAIEIRTEREPLSVCDSIGEDHYEFRNRIGNKPKEDVPNKIEPHGLSQDRIKDLVYFYEYILEEHYKYV